MKNLKNMYPRAQRTPIAKIGFVPCQKSVFADILNYGWGDNIYAVCLQAWN
jgi:hypothetical protein